MKKIVRLLALVIALAGSGTALAATSWEYYQAGLKYYNQKQYMDSIRYFQAAVQADPNNWQAYQGLAYSYYGQGDRTDCLAAADQSLRINPNNPQLKQFTDALRAQVPASAAPCVR